MLATVLTGGHSIAAWRGGSSCRQCGKRLATLRLQVMTGGSRKTYHICNDCALAWGDAVKLGGEVVAAIVEQAMG